PVFAVEVEAAWFRRSAEWAVHALAVVAVVSWLPFCCFEFRVDRENVCGIGDERGWYTREAQAPNPILLDDYRAFSFAPAGKGMLATSRAACPELAATDPDDSKHVRCRRVLHFPDSSTEQRLPHRAEYPLAEDVDGRIAAVMTGEAVGMTGY